MSMTATRRLVLCLVCACAAPAMAGISEQTQAAARAFAGTAAAPATAAVTPAQISAAGGLVIVDRPFESPLPIPRASSTPAKAVGLPIAPPPPPPPPPPKKWEVKVADVNLLGTFQRWGVEAGYRIKWDAARHVLVDAPGTVEGSFEDAVTSVLSSPGIKESEYPLEVCFYANHVARITRRGEQQKECR